MVLILADEKYLFSEKREVEEVKGYSRTNAMDIIAIGFDPKKTFIFSDFEYVGGEFYANIVRFAKRVTYNQVRATFGFDGRYAHPKFRLHLHCVLTDPIPAPTSAKFTLPVFRGRRPSELLSRTSLAPTGRRLLLFHA